jgi:flagellar hook-associated protein 2
MNITNILGAGSGIDTKALIESLAAAVREPKAALIAKREAANEASLSSLSQVSSSIDSFASALSTLISGGTLFSQPSVSNSAILGASAIAGARLGGLSAQVEVQQLAQAQSLVSGPIASRTAPIGQGELTLTTAKGSFAITVDAANDSLDGLAKAINAKNTGVQASIVTDQGAAKLVLKSQTGTNQAFTLGVPSGTSSGLERFAFGPGVPGGMTQAQAAQDAILVLDGVEVRRGSNSFNDLIEGVQFDLKAAQPGTLVSIGVTRPTAAITQGVNDFVAAYNELQSILKEATAAAAEAGDEGGPLQRDLSVRELKRQLASLTSTVLNSSGGPATLAEIGVFTNRDGTLGVNSFRLQSAMEADPDGVEKLFNPGQSSSSPFLTIANAIGKVKPGTYTITNVTPGGPGVDASGFVNGVAMLGSETGLVAPAGSAALGMILKVGGPVTSATITVDAGLGGALQAIRDSLRARTGPIAASQDRLRREADSIAQERDKMETRYEAYYDQLVKNFTAMERRVSSFKATQSYLDQQIKMWSGGN